MITEEEYLKAKSIVEEYERMDNNLRIAIESDDDLDPEQRAECSICGEDVSFGGKHAPNCPEDDSPFAELCRLGYG